MHALYSILPLLIDVVIASPVAQSKVLHERREYIPQGWTKGGRVPSHAILPVRIGLTQSNLDKGHDLLMEV